jgi:ribosome biogenesis GTPase
MRQDEWRSKSFAANLDQLLIMLAGEPMFSESQLNRALIAAEDAGIRAVLLLNKVDLPTGDLARERLAPYRAMGLTVLETSLKAQPEAALALLGPVLAGHTTLVLGPSGMGKSTLINLMLPQAQAQVGEISQALNAGRHTTTTTTWYWLDDAVGAGPWRADRFAGLPGVRPDAHHAAAPARADARSARPAGPLPLLQLHPPARAGCGVREAVDRGEISPTRYRLYEALWDELEAGQRPG